MRCPRSASIPAWAQGPLLTLAVVAAVEAVSLWLYDIRRMSPLLLAVAVGAALGGVRSGLLSAAVALVFLAMVWARSSEPFLYAQLDVQRLILFVVSGPAAAVLVGVLRRRAWRAAEEAWQQRRLAEARRAEVEARLRETTALLAVSQIVDEGIDPGEALRRVCRELSRLTEADTVSAYLKDPSGAELRPTAAYHVPKEMREVLAVTPLPLEALGFAPETLREGRIVWSDDIPGDPRFDHPLFRRFPHQSGAAIPLGLDDAVAGAFYLTWWTERQRLDAAMLATLQAIGQQAGTLLRNVRLREALEVRATRLSTLARLNRDLSASLDMSQVLREIARDAAILMNVPLGRIWVADEATRMLTARASWDTEIAVEPLVASLRFGEGLVGWIAQHRTPLNVPDVFADPRFVANNWWRTRGLSSFLGVPIVRDGRLLAVLALAGRQMLRLDSDEEELLGGLVAQAATALRNAALFEALETTQASLEEARQRNETILNAAGDGIYGLDGKGRAVFVNTATCAMTGYRQEELLGQSVHALLHHSKPDGSPYPADECPGLATLRDGAIHVARDETFWRKDGSGLPVEYVTTPIREGDQVVGAVVVLRDVTERRAIERMKEDFISTASHQLRTPLAAIRGHLELVLDGEAGPLTETQTRFLEIAIASADGLGALVNDLLDADRIEKGRVGQHRERVELPALIEDLATIFRLGAERKGLAFVVETADVPAIPGDRDRLFQALSNLVANAVRYTERGEIRLSLGRAAEGVEVTVADTGIGMTEDERAHLFGRFYRGDHPLVRAQAGTGLGLVIAKGIVEQHGGAIRVESKRGEGSQFHVRLPVAEAMGGRES